MATKVRFNAGELRSEMMKRDVDQLYLAELIGRGVTSVSLRMNGHVSWMLDECYKILDVFDLPASDLPRVFPPVA